MGTPTSINVVSSIPGGNGTTKTYDVQCYDFTNAAAVATNAGTLLNTTAAINSLGAIGALSATPVIWEIRARRSGLTSGPGTVTVDSVEIRY
jgi:hypothetical protein